MEASPEIIRLGRVLRIVDHEQYLPEHQARYREVTHLKLPPLELANATKVLLKFPDGHRLAGVFWHLLSIAAATPVRGFFVRSGPDGVEPMRPGQIARLLNLTESAWTADQARLTEDAGLLAIVGIDVDVAALRKSKSWSPAGVAVRKSADDMPLFFSGDPPDRTAIRPIESNSTQLMEENSIIDRASAVKLCEMQTAAGVAVNAVVKANTARENMGDAALVMVLAQQMPAFGDLMRKAGAGTLSDEEARQFARDRNAVKGIARRWIDRGVLAARLDRFGELAAQATAKASKPMAYLLSAVRNEWDD